MTAGPGNDLGAPVVYPPEEEVAAVSSGLFVTRTFKPMVGGGEQNAHQITKHLNEFGERVTVVTTSRRGHAETELKLPPCPVGCS